MKEISVSILANEDKFSLIEKVNKSKADYIHLDVMDNKFVPNKFLTVGELEKVIKKIHKKIDVHLMVENPANYIKKIALYDIGYITIHYEIKDFLDHIDTINNLGIRSGLSIKPSTDIEEIFPYLNKINLVLIMSVEPGASGQEFIKETGEKIKKLKEEINKRGLNVKISVDGGINDQVKEYVADADILVSASFALNNLDNLDILKN